MKNYKVGGLFSGVGGIELGFQNQGFDIAWANEIDTHCSKTYQLNFKHKFILEDIHKIKGSSLEPVDVLTGGFPCQAFSVAGYRKGLKDERGNLFYEILRLISELKYKPRVLLLENVKNFSSHDKGRTLQILRDELESLGYCVFNHVLNTAKYTGIPQNRERTFIICFLEGKDAYLNSSKTMTNEFKKLFPPKKVNTMKDFKKMLDKQVDDKFFYKKEKYMYKELKKNMKSKDTFYQWRRQYVRENKSQVCPTLTANMGTGGHNVPLILTDNGIRKLTPKECFLLQGFPKSFKLPNDVANSHLYKQAGNSVTVKMIEVLAGIIKKCLVTDDSLR